MDRYGRKETAFMVVSNRKVVQVEIAAKGGGLYTVRLPEGGMIRVKGHRLSASPEEAEQSIQRRRAPAFRMAGTAYT